jgi:hypothetical protein
VVGCALFTVTSSLYFNWGNCHFIDLIKFVSVLALHLYSSEERTMMPGRPSCLSGETINVICFIGTLSKYTIGILSH